MYHFKDWRSRYWTIVLFSLFGAFLSHSTTQAQITPDDTLGAERSTVRALDAQRDQIEGGAIRGSNLFHSFQDFNIDEGRAAYFGNPDGIETILSRVTGGNPSRLLGTLGVLGNADLFLLNPNGIVFGANARLDVRGSFVATTADAFQFGNQGFFSATNPELPSLLTIHPSALQFNRATAGRIENQAIDRVGTNTFGEPQFGLRVPDNHSLLLVGGDILLDRGQINVASGRVELAGMSGVGTIGLNTEGNGLSLNLPETSDWADLSLRNRAIVNTSGENGGTIQLWGKRILLNEGSQITARTLGAGTGGGININASESVQIVGESPTAQRTGVSTGTQGTGNAGDLTITAPVFQIIAGARVATNTSGVGNAGDLTVNASDFVQVTGFTNRRNFGSDLFAQAGQAATGNAGNLTITTRQLLVENGGQVGASTFGVGDAGNLRITASELIRVDGRESGIFSQTYNTDAERAGDGGTITITTEKFYVQNVGQIGAASLGTGNGGNIIVNASELIRISGDSTDEFGSGMFTSSRSVEPGAGDAGDIVINTAVVVLRRGAQIIAFTVGTGQGGNLVIHASERIRLSSAVSDASLLITQTQGEGNAGNITVRAPRVGLIGNSQFVTATGGAGDAGKLRVNTDRLFVQDGLLLTSSFDAGNGGDLVINATDSIRLVGESSEDRSGLLSATQGSGDAGSISIRTAELFVEAGARISSDTVATGNAGNINIMVRQLHIEGGGLISAGTTSEGNGANLVVNATEYINIVGGSEQNASGLFTETQGIGDAGNLLLNAANLRVEDGAQIRAGTSPESSGAGGDLNVNVAEQVILRGRTADGAFPSGLFTQTRGRGNAGDLTIRAPILLVHDGAIATAETLGRGTGGRLLVNASDLVQLTNGGQLSAEATRRNREAGSLNITTDQFILEGNASATVSSPRGQAGNLTVRADLMRLDGAEVSAEAGVGDGANIRLNLDRLQMEHGSLISAQAFDAANGGNLTINTGDGFIVAIPDQNSDIIANAFEGQGGNIQITAQGIFGIEQRSSLPINGTNDIDASSQLGVDGQITINTPDVDPSRGLVNLPTETATPQIDQRCQPGGSATNRFVATGRGGLPASPAEPGNENLWEDLRSPISETSRPPAETRSPTIATEAAIVEAQGWIVDEQGRITLVAQAPMVTATHPHASSLGCQPSSYTMSD